MLFLQFNYCLLLQIGLTYVIFIIESSQTL
nr:MAG TPA: hypothetical protein [Caudoviricetes sp.]